jgi:cell division protein FtsA
MIDVEGVQVGIDIGTSKTVVVISQRDELENKLLILGMGQSRNQGIRKGKIVNLENTITSIRKAAEDAVLMAGVEFRSATINIPGDVDCINSKGIAGISRKDREVKAMDIQRVLEQAQLLDIGQAKHVLHVFPQYFKLDEQDHIKDPMGMTGLRLEGHVHLVTVPKINVQNVVKCVTRAGFAPREGLATSFASANAVISEEDKETGVLVLDIGAGTTDVIGFMEGYPIFSSVIVLGGNNLTRDLGIGLKVAEGMAENIKKRYGCVYEGLVDPMEEIEVPVYGGNHVQRISKQTINTILEPRAEEIMMMVKKKIEEKGFGIENFSSAVLTGGTSKLSGIAELTEKVLGIPTRIGVPLEVGGIVDEVTDPSFSTAIGLCIGEKSRFMNTTAASEKKTILSGESGSAIKKIGNFFKEIFG